MVAEAAVVGRPDDMTGEAICAFVVLKQARPTGDEAEKIAKELRDWVGKEIGPIAKPKDIRFGENLPKTRSGKIMRRLLRSIAKGEEITQDVSTLENPAILDQLKQVELSRRVAVRRRGATGVRYRGAPPCSGGARRTPPTRDPRTVIRPRESDAASGCASSQLLPRRSPLLALIAGQGSPATCSARASVGPAARKAELLLPAAARSSPRRCVKLARFDHAEVRRRPAPAAGRRCRCSRSATSG